VFPKARLIDLSVPLQHLAASEPIPAQIHYVRHDGEGLDCLPVKIAGASAGWCRAMALVPEE
jgi:hypothetical protein